MSATQAQIDQLLAFVRQWYPGARSVVVSYSFNEYNDSGYDSSFPMLRVYGECATLLESKVVTMGDGMEYEADEHTALRPFRVYDVSWADGSYDRDIPEPLTFIL